MPPQMTRLMMIFGLLIALYVFMRWVSKPESFYWYGHYRGDALAEIASMPITFAEISTCSDCHVDEAAANQAGPHHNISCQSCHGPGTDHNAEPTADNIIRPEVTDTCLLCHQFNYARPATFPQIEVPDHNEGFSCNECHVVHNPEDFQ